MDNKRYHVAGMPTTFTPSRNADWIDDFNSLIDETQLSRNKLVEHLIVLGIEKKRESNHSIDSEKSNIPQQQQQGIIISSENFNEEQIELLNTKHYRRIIEEFTFRLLNIQNEATEHALKEFGQGTAFTSIESPVNETASTTVLNSENENHPIVQEREKPSTETETNKVVKADLSEAMALLKSMKE